MTNILLTLSLFFGAVPASANEPLTGKERAFLKRQARSQEKQKKYAVRNQRIERAKKAQECREEYATQFSAFQEQLNKMITGASQYLESSKDFAEMKTASTIISKLGNPIRSETRLQHDLAANAYRKSQNLLNQELERRGLFQIDDVTFQLGGISIYGNTTRLFLQSRTTTGDQYLGIILPNNGEAPYIDKNSSRFAPEDILWFAKVACRKVLLDQIQLSRTNNPQAEPTNVEAASAP